MIEPDEYEAWKASPVTAWFFQAMITYAQDAKDDVIAMVWESGATDPIEIAKKRGQAFSAVYFAKAPFDDIAKYHEAKE